MIDEPTGGVTGPPDRALPMLAGLAAEAATQLAEWLAAEEAAAG